MRYETAMSDADQTAPGAEILGCRPGLPDDLRLLLARYPRDCWMEHENLGAMARFWLSRHAMFRELGDALGSATRELVAGRVEPRGFAGWFAPRLEFLLSHLHTHHQIEDFHYFPIFRAADERLARGFGLLESDHHVIHTAMDGAVDAANAFLRAVDPGGEELQRAAAGYAAASDPMLDLLIRHLDDEEDLIVPLILDRGEAALGVGH
jgi:hypothetical protein